MQNIKSEVEKSEKVVIFYSGQEMHNLFMFGEQHLLVDAIVTEDALSEFINLSSRQHPEKIKQLEENIREKCRVVKKVSIYCENV